MHELDDLVLKTEIEEISKKIDDILLKVEEVNPSRPGNESAVEK